MPQKLLKRHILLAGLEPTYGTPPALAGADAVLVENFQHNPAQESMLLDRQGITGGLGPPRNALVGRLGGVSFDAEIKCGAGGTLPEIAPILRCCGLNETIDAGVDVIYATSNDPIVSSAAQLWDGGADMHALAGLRGNLTINLESGTYGRINAELQGHPTDPVATARPTPAYAAQVPVPLKQLVVSVQGFFHMEVYSAVLSMNNTLAAPATISGDFASGYSEVQITEWNPELVLTLAAEDIADGYDPFADWASGVGKSLVVGPVGAGIDNTYQLAALTAVVTNISTGDQDGKLTYEVTFQLAESALGASDHFSLAFT